MFYLTSLPSATMTTLFNGKREHARGNAATRELIPSLWTTRRGKCPRSLWIKRASMSQLGVSGLWETHSGDWDSWGPERGTRGNTREQGWRCNLLQGEDVSVQRQGKLCWKDRVRTEALRRCSRRTNTTVWSLVSKASQWSERLNWIGETARTPRASAATWRKGCRLNFRLFKFVQALSAVYLE